LDVYNKPTEGDKVASMLRRVCRNCGYQSVDSEGGLVLETNLKETTSEGYHALVNEFTKLDPTLPHVDTLKCPKVECPSNAGDKKRDVIYIKYDPVELKFLYICNVCDARWKSKA
jgi:DNA-directed RNA polymerase subunit M/transcription elongation factor TFIIS